MTVDSIKANLEDFLDFMKSRGFPVYHLSNIFLRDFQYAVRDYFRTATKKDIGTRLADKYAREIVQYMESQGLMTRFSGNAWTLHMERYLVPPQEKEEKKEEQESAA